MFEEIFFLPVMMPHQAFSHQPGEDKQKQGGRQHDGEE
jgi:hypothetical protein